MCGGRPLLVSSPKKSRVRSEGEGMGVKVKPPTKMPGGQQMPIRVGVLGYHMQVRKCDGSVCVVPPQFWLGIGSSAGRSNSFHSARGKHRTEESSLDGTDRLTPMFHAYSLVPLSMSVTAGPAVHRVLLLGVVLCRRIDQSVDVTIVVCN
jgi:hypothetical protein